MADKVHFQIATADGSICDEMISYALVPMTNGDAGIMAGHAPMLAALREGVVKYITDGEEHFAALSGGVLSVAYNELIILARTAEKAEDIDIARAQASEGTNDLKVRGYVKRHLQNEKYHSIKMACRLFFADGKPFMIHCPICVGLQRKIRFMPPLIPGSGICAYPDL